MYAPGNGRRRRTVNEVLQLAVQPPALLVTGRGDPAALTEESGFVTPRHRGTPPTHTWRGPFILVRPGDRSSDRHARDTHRSAVSEVILLRRTLRHVTEVSGPRHLYGDGCRGDGPPTFSNLDVLDSWEAS